MKIEKDRHERHGTQLQNYASAIGIDLPSRQQSACWHRGIIAFFASIDTPMINVAETNKGKYTW